MRHVAQPAPAGRTIAAEESGKDDVLEFTAASLFPAVISAGAASVTVVAVDIGPVLLDGSKMKIPPAPTVRQPPDGSAAAAVAWSVPLETVVPPP